jgi:hypothetical protein
MTTFGICIELDLVLGNQLSNGVTYLYFSQTPCGSWIEIFVVAQKNSPSARIIRSVSIEIILIMFVFVIFVLNWMRG